MTETAVAAARATPPRHFTLRYPDSWWKLDLDTRTRDAAIRRAIADQVKGATVDRAKLEAAVRGARKSAREAHARGALQVAGMLMFTDGGESLSAMTVVTRVTVPPEESMDLAALMLPVALQNASNPLGKGTAANTSEIITIPELGSAGRVTQIEDIDYYDRATVRTALMHTVVPVPHSRELLVVSCTTPNLSLVDSFFDVFDAISSTLRFQP
ncbi:hypothetical protein AB0H77_29525 [Streptomyces sp. NPDC050844]|uniref:hypothetical protein n=1 Tax=Streptomyces sp. NPDC050844 TaxID=3155790 RepID=UPI0033DC1DBC